MDARLLHHTADLAAEYLASLDERPVRACSTLLAPGMRVVTRRHAAGD